MLCYNLKYLDLCEFKDLQIKLVKINEVFANNF